MRLTRLILALFFTLSALACEPPIDSTPDADSADAADVSDTMEVVDGPRIRVATFNVRRLFDRNCDSGRCDPGDFEEVPGEQEYDLTLQRTADAIAQMDVDVVLLQEVENAIVLDDLRSRMPGEYNVGILGETGFAASLDVGIISRGELLGTRSYRDSRPLQLPGGGETVFSREFLQVDLQFEGEKVVLFNAHFKSKSNDDPERRLAEAQEAREIVEEAAAREPDALVILGGDLNDTPGSDPLNALTANNGLLRAGAEKPASEMWTYDYRGDRQAIDHLLVARTNGGSYIETSAQVVRGQAGGGLADSDHAALHADFQLN
ncbi:MAG: endonuclease/exonuclease/phosphatase family protein [Myxococcota bacterium]